MSLRPGLRAAACVLAAAGALWVIVWTERSLWRKADELRARASAVSSERFHLSEALETRLRSLNDLVFRHSIEPQPSARERIANEVASLQGWFAAHTNQPLTRPEHEVLARAAERLGAYLTHARPLVDGTGAPPDLRAWRAENERLHAGLLELAVQLTAAEKHALGEHLRGTERSLVALHRQTVVSSLLLLAMGASLVVLVYQGAVAPLRQRLRQTQAVLERQEKLSSLGVLAAGVAHEIRNPLTSIKARLFTQQPLLAKGSEAWEDNVFITGEISRLERIVRDFLAFARPGEPRFVTLKAAEPLRELVPLLQPELRQSNIELNQEVLADPLVRADAAQLKQVLINLVKNAADALGRNGAITLRARTETRGRGPHATTRAVLEVQDTGPGIPPEVQPRLFDPFFTTKASGTGLGLSIAARIVENHGGRLEFSTAPHRGTTFRLVLPIASEAAS
jgi:signal transduction histidine kinase